MFETSMRAMRRRLLATVPAALLALTTQAHASWCAERCDQVVVDWNATAHQVIKATDGYADPLAASRSLAMMHLAMHDAVNAVQPRYAPYAAPVRDRAQPGADAAVAAVSAAHDVLLALYPKQQPMLRAALDATLHDAGIGASIGQGRKLGADAAAAVLAQRAADGSQASETYRPGNRPGEYQFVPGFDFIALPHWRAVKPFALRAPAQFRVAPPPALGSAEYTAAFDEVKAVGGKQPAARRSADESQYAAFWYEFSDSGWNRVARTVARSKPQDLWERARTFAMLNAVMADAYIAGWDSKMHYNLWRPVTAIRLAADDGNTATTPDVAWDPLLPTPPIQDYPSTHSALGAAAAAVLAQAFGDAVKFEFASPSALPEHPTRRFESFSSAARENAESRVKAGLHFRFAITQGLRLGEQIGQHANATMLQPLH